MGHLVERHNSKKLSAISLSRIVLGIFILLAASVFLHAEQAHASGIRRPANNLGLIGYWSLEDATGTIATDFSGKGSVGSVTGTAIWNNGKNGKALSLNGSSYIGLGGSVFPRYSSSTPYTIALWIKSSASASTYTIYSEASTASDSRSLRINVDGSNKVRLYIQNDAGSVLTNSAGNTVVIDGNWHHIAITDTPGAPKLYIDGVLDANLVGYNPASSVFTFNTASIGARKATSVANYFNGLMDDVRIYNRALSAPEIASLYGVSAVKINSSLNNFMTNGLVGLWSFDGTDIRGSTAYDRSGNGNNGTLSGGPTTTEGKRGQALKFDGVNDFVDAGNAAELQLITGDYTISAWAKPAILTGSQPIISKSYSSNGKAYSLTLSGDEVHVDGEFEGNDDYVETTSANLVAGNWYHLAATLTSSTLAVNIYVNGVAQATVGTLAARPVDVSSDLTFGLMPYAGTYFQGAIDEVRLYNRALSAAEVSQLYTLGSTVMNKSLSAGAFSDHLVLWHTFDGPRLNATTSTDSSGQGNNGTLAGGPVTAIGKTGQALSFDGSNDVVTIANPTSTIGANTFTALTVSMWVKPANLDDGMVFFGTAAANNRSPWIHSEAVGGDFSTLRAFINTSASVSDCLATSNAGAIAAGVWTHVVFSWDGTTCQLYTDGVANGASDTSAVNLMNDPITWHIGYAPLTGRTRMNGELDDVRVYNRAFSAAEVLRLYNATK